MKSVIIVLSALCLATIVAAIDTPAKPTPPTEYTLAAFAITPGGYVSARTYYDQANQRARTDMFDKNFSQVGEFIGLFQANKGYWYDSTSGQCQGFALNSPWVNTWDFLNNAVFISSDEYYPGRQCDLWVTELDTNFALAACFSDNAPVFMGLYNGTSVNSLYFITSFESSVDPSVFSLPSTCSNSFKLSSSMPLMNLKKFKVPAHPLLF
jgi:hypothetical protein